MTVLVLADLHLDLWFDADRDPLAALPRAVWDSLDALIVAGDLSNKPRVRWKPSVAYLTQYVAPERVFLIPGNHDYYDHCIDGDDRLRAIAEDEGVNFAQQSVVEVGDTRFLCCTLWTDFELDGNADASMAGASAKMNDYRYSRFERERYRRVRPNDTARVHRRHRAWLEERLAENFGGKSVVVTHHCPHPDLIGDRCSEIGSAYASDLRSVIGTFQPAQSLFGHTHHSAEAEVGACAVRNVSLGYPGEVLEAQEGLLLRRGLIETGAGGAA